MSKLLRDLKSIKVWLTVFCCVGVWTKHIDTGTFGLVTVACIGSRTINERRFENKDSA